MITSTAIALSLYEKDYLLWTEKTVQQLQARNFDALDIDNLIEEIESLGRSQRRELNSRLGELLEHLLKRTYVKMPDCYRVWVESVDKQRLALRNLLKDSPSLKPYFVEVFDEVYADTLRLVCRSYPNFSFPEEWPFERSIQAILTIDFWEK